MLQQAPLRFLLADDAGAGKTIMTGLYVREMLSRRLIRRVLIVPPAGLVGNWEREMRSLFRLPFRIVGGPDARSGNPFVAPHGDLVIISIDTLAGDRTFSRLADPATPPYDLVVFDEAHKLSAHREPTTGYGRPTATGWRRRWPAPAPTARAGRCTVGAASPAAHRHAAHGQGRPVLVPVAPAAAGRALDHRRVRAVPARVAEPPLHPAHQGRDGPLRRHSPVPATELRHPELRPVAGSGQRAGTLRRHHRLHPLLLQPGAGVEPVGRTPGDERVPAAPRQFDLCPDAFVRTAPRQSSGL